MNICVKLLGLYATTAILVHFHLTETVKPGAGQQIPSVKKSFRHINISVKTFKDKAELLQVSECAETVYSVILQKKHYRRKAHMVSKKSQPH